MKRLIELKCPSCANPLEVGEDREFFFCQYCGTKIVLNDEIKVTYRLIDDADIKRAETERMVQLKEMELAKKSHVGRIALFVLWLIVVIAMFVVSIILLTTGPKDEDDPGYILLIFAMVIGIYGALGFWGNSGKDKRKSPILKGIQITSAIANAKGKNYEELTAILKGVGFSKITCIPLKDLNLFTGGKNGQVETITINGDEDVDEGDIYPSDSPVTISYHSFR